MCQAMNLQEIRACVTATLAGQNEEFEKIVYEFKDGVYNLCYRLLSQRQEAEDATQETFLRAYSKLKRYDHERSFKTWLFSIASNYCIDQIRRRRMTLLSIDDEPTAAALSLRSDEPSPERAAIVGEAAEEIQRMLATLPADYRLAVVLRYWYDYSYSEIAEVSGSSISAIKSKLFRARQRLANSLSRDDHRVGGEARPGKSAEERLSLPEKGEE